MIAAKIHLHCYRISLMHTRRCSLLSICNPYTWTASRGTASTSSIVSPSFSTNAAYKVDSNHTVLPSIDNHDDTEETNTEASKMIDVINPIPDFNTNALAFREKTTIELIRAGMTFGLCTITPLVQNGMFLVRYSYRIFGSTITEFFLRMSFYHHFCGGENLTSIETTKQQLQHAGIGCILDYAAEEDSDNTNHAVIHDETKYDRNMERFRQCIHHAAPVTTTSSSATNSSNSRSYVAIKVTGLGDASILARMSHAIRNRRKFDLPNDYNGAINILERSRRDHDVADESLKVTLTNFEVEAFDRIYNRCCGLARTAKECGTHLLFDAEQVRFQPAIDALVLHLQRTYNCITKSDYPIIYNTYQSYLKDSIERLQFDLEMSKRYQYHMGIKLVRGAYMESERSLAKKLNEPSPIHHTLNETHSSYDTAIGIVLRHAAQQQQHCNNVGRGALVELMCATHNQASIEHAISTMNDVNIDRTSTCISFAQLFGMKDCLTYNLTLHEFSVYKYVPYGEISMVTPYLLRRANENSAIRGGAYDELKLILNELGRRVKVKIGLN